MMSATILKIDEPTCPEACERVKALCAALEGFVSSGQDGGLAEYLNSIELEEDDDDIEDLRQWLPALVHFDALLARLSARVVTTYSNPDSSYAENCDSSLPWTLSYNLSKHFTHHAALFTIVRATLGKTTRVAAVRVLLLVISNHLVVVIVGHRSADQPAVSRDCVAEVGKHQPWLPIVVCSLIYRKDNIKLTW